MKKREEKYCLLQGLNPHPNGVQENRGKIAQSGAKSTLQKGGNA